MKITTTLVSHLVFAVVLCLLALSDCRRAQPFTRLTAYRARTCLGEMMRNERELQVVQGGVSGFQPPPPASQALDLSPFCSFDASLTFVARKFFF